MLNNYKGCMVGALIGDCVGRLFEKPRKWLQYVEVDEILSAIRHHMENPEPPLPYTDDTAMTHALAESLLRSRGFEAQDVAKSFTRKYFDEEEKQHMYARVTDVFKAWDLSNYEGDLFGPSKAQFAGMGSIGNGGGMRIAPVPLYFANDITSIIEVARLSTQLTHHHSLGYYGAILQAYAIHTALNCKDLDPSTIIRSLLSFCATVIESEDPEKPYAERLRRAMRLLDVSKLTTIQAVEELGHSVKALDAIPMAIFCALRSLKSIPEIKSDNPFERCIIYAISMGGDTDTIASMAGAISGALYGISYIPESWRNMCESSEKTLVLAENLFMGSKSAVGNAANSGSTDGII